MYILDNSLDLYYAGNLYLDSIMKDFCDKILDQIREQKDTADYIGPFRAVAVMPVHGRLPLVSLTIQRLLVKNRFHAVICLGDSPEEEKICRDAGAGFIYHANRPIGRKLNTGFQIAADYDPHAVMYVSSSDWLSDNWLDVVSSYVGEFDLVGKLDGCFFCVCHVNMF